MKTLEELGTSLAPWKACSYGIGGYEIRCGGCCESSPDYEGENIVADVDYKADARLIAAAPDLYAAALPFVSLIDWMLRSAAPLGIIDIVPAIRKHGDALRRAIKKAGGEDATVRSRLEAKE